LRTECKILKLSWAGSSMVEQLTPKQTQAPTLAVFSMLYLWIR